jgi:hypothetical protein
MDIFDIKMLGEAMRPEGELTGHWAGNTIDAGPQEAFRLSREERDYIAGHALDSIYERAKNLTAFGDCG